MASEHIKGTPIRRETPRKPGDLTLQMIIECVPVGRARRRANRILADSGMTPRRNAKVMQALHALDAVAWAEQLSEFAVM